MWNKIPTDYSDKATAVAADSCFGFDSVANDNKNITVQAIWDFAMTDNTTDDLSEWAINKYVSTANVDAAWATMNTDTTLATNWYFLDEDDMISDDATKVASQQSIKAFVTNFGANINGLPAETTIEDADEFIFYDDSAAANRKITQANLRTAMTESVFIVNKTGTQGISAATETVVSFDSEVSDIDWVFASNQFIAPVTWLYQINAMVSFSWGNEVATLRLTNASGTVYQNNEYDGDISKNTVWFGTILSLTASDVVELRVETSSASTIQALGTTFSWSRI